jgi:Tfp pilus assembly protein PilF
MGYQLISFGRLRDSRPFLEKAIRLDPELVEAYASMGDLLDKEGNHEQAVRYFRDALQRNPGHVDSYLGLGKSLLALEKYADVIVEMKKVIQLDPSNPQPHLHLTQAYQAVGDRENAARESLRDEEAGKNLQQR